MAKIAMIGAGSLVFCKTLAMDILATNASATSATPRTGRNTTSPDAAARTSQALYDERRYDRRLTEPAYRILRASPAVAVCRPALRAGGLLTVLSDRA